MERSCNEEPLLLQVEEEKVLNIIREGCGKSLASSSFTAEGDIEPIRNFSSFSKEFQVESKKLWYLAAPAIFTSVCQYSLGAITQLFAGHISTLDLAAVSVENSVIAGFSFGVMMGMGSALETLCGQAYGAKQLDMLGIYMQRSWVILNSTSLLLSLLYIFATPFLKAIGQEDHIAKAAGTFTLWMIPQLFAYSMNFPIAKFLQSQSKMMVMAAVSAVALLLHTFFSWLLMLKLGWGLVGAAVVLNASWWFIVVVQLVYIFSGTCGRAWTGFSWKAFQNLWAFVKLSLASAIMLCLEVWYYMALILFAGYLKNPEISVDALSICMNILGWALMVAIGSNAATSVRISNELGAGNPRTAKFSVVVVVITSFMLGLLLSLILIITRKNYPSAFTSSTQVKELVYKITPLLAISIIVNNVQPVLSDQAPEEIMGENNGNGEKKVDLIFFPGSNDNPGNMITPIQLHGPNYDKWARAIRTSLQAKRKYDFVEGKVPKPMTPEKLEDWTAVHSMLIAWLLNTIEPSLRSTLSYYDDAQSLWTHLKQRFCVVNGTRICQLKASLGECKQGKGEEVSAYFGRLSRIWDELVTYVKQPTCKCGGSTCEINKQVIDLHAKDYLHHFLMGLDGAYAMIRSNLLSQDPLPNIDQAYQRVIQDERLL